MSGFTSIGSIGGTSYTSISKLMGSVLDPLSYELPGI